MNISKFFKLSAVFSAVICIILYGAILFQTISMLEFQYALILLFAAEALLVLTIIFAVFSILVSKDILDTIKTKKIIIVSTITVVIGCVSSIVYGAFSCYNLYTPEDIIENDKEYVQSFFPYQDITEWEKGYMDIEVSHIPGTDRICLWNIKTSTSGYQCNYKLEYFKSASPFMTGKFRLDRSFLTPFNDLDFDVWVPGKKMKIDGVKLTAFIDGYDYAVLIKSFNQSVYASLTKNMSASEITFEDFAREVIKQMEQLDAATKEKVFLDVPLSEAF